MLVDGHLRAETTPDAIVPVLVLDVDEAEADKILLTHDPLAGMATVSEPQLDELLANVQTESTAMRAMIDAVGIGCRASDVGEEALQPPEVRVPECYQVVVECRDELDQEDVFNRMRAEGHQCRVLTL
jgi:hypothetical protein